MIDSLFFAVLMVIWLKVWTLTRLSDCFHAADRPILPARDLHPVKRPTANHTDQPETFIL